MQFPNYRDLNKIVLLKITKKSRKIRKVVTCNLCNKVIYYIFNGGTLRFACSNLSPDTLYRSEGVQRTNADHIIILMSTEICHLSDCILLIVGFPKRRVANLMAR